MDLRALKYFQAVYEVGSVSGAARRCFVSQPSISSAIQQLESELDTRLFIRHARGVIATDSADILYPKAKELLQCAKSITQIFNEGPKKVVLRLGIMRSLGAKRISLLLKKVTKKIDNLEITLVEPEEPCDARVIFSESTRAQETFIPIWQDNYQLAMPGKWPLARKNRLTLSNLNHMPFINRDPCAALEKFKEMLNKKDIYFQPRANIKTIEYACQLVSAGIGAALLPDWQEIKDTEGVILQQIDGVSIKKQIGLAFNSKRNKDSLIKAITDVCKQTYTI